jgi:DNA-binding MarR family transcriptional regulator
MNEINVHPAAEENPGFLLWRVSTQWSRSTTAALKAFGLSHPQFVILAIIDRQKEKGTSQEEIEIQAVLDSKPTAHLLRSLQVKGLIEPTDKSRYLLTKSGEKILEKALPVIERADADFFESIDLTSSKMVTTFQTLARANL